MSKNQKKVYLSCTTARKKDIWIEFEQNGRQTDINHKKVECDSINAVLCFLDSFPSECNSVNWYEGNGTISYDFETTS